MSVTFFPENGWDFPASVNLSNRNAAMILEHLGLWSEDLFGSADAEDFEGRILLARALVPADEGMPSYELRGERGATMVMGGREAGYTEGVLDRLSELTDSAKARGLRVLWG